MLLIRRTVCGVTTTERKDVTGLTTDSVVISHCRGPAPSPPQPVRPWQRPLLHTAMFIARCALTASLACSFTLSAGAEAGHLTSPPTLSIL